MKVKSVLSKTIMSLDLEDAEVVSKYIRELEIPKNIFSKEYKEVRNLELELIRYQKILALLQKYDEKIEFQKTEFNYFRNSDDTVIVLHVEFHKKKDQKAFEKELEEIGDSKRKFKKGLKKKK